MRQATIGVNAQTITPTLAAGLKLPRDWGVILSDVVPGGPGDHGGLRPGDIVISMDGVPVESLPKYTAFLYLHPKSLPMQMEVLRHLDTVKVSVTPQDWQGGMDSLADMIDPQKGLIAQLGVFVVDLTPKVAETVAPLRSEGGVVVAALLDNEPQVDTDLEAGDVIHSFNGKVVKDCDDLRAGIDRLKPGDPAVLQVERQGQYRYVGFEME